MTKSNVREPVKVTCPRCGYEWYTKSVMSHVTCPKCRYMVKINEVLNDVR